MKRNITSPELKAAHMALERGASFGDKEAILALEARVAELEKKVSSQAGLLTKTRKAIREFIQ